MTPPSRRTKRFKASASPVREPAFGTTLTAIPADGIGTPPVNRDEPIARVADPARLRLGVVLASGDRHTPVGTSRPVNRSDLGSDPPLAP
jgi:hypothetical protein